MEFLNAYDHGFARVAACTVPVTPADPRSNLVEVLAAARTCDQDGVALAIFPELCLSGYAIDDLHLAAILLTEVEQAVADLVTASADLTPVLVVGGPVAHRNRVYNAAFVIHRGELLGIATKSYLPTYREFYERRWFASGEELSEEIRYAGHQVPIGSDLIFEATDVPGLSIFVEICEDMWVPVPPHARASLAGATVLANLSASPVTVGRADARRLLVSSASSRCNAAYIYTAAGYGESTTDLSWDGQAMIYELGEAVAESERFPAGTQVTVADVHLGRLVAERLRQGTHDDNRRDADADFRVVEFELGAPRGDIGLRREVDRFPFVPNDPDRLEAECFEAYNIQVSGLERRLQAVGDAKVVIGVSGGLDSTHALIVAAKAMDRLGRPRGDILAFTMPGFATSDATKSNAIELMKAVGCSYEVLDITAAATQMLRDLRHPAGDGEPVYDVTFENVQAGLRTDYLFRLANQRGGIVLGTGDLSELALGWCTYGVGDQMSHYGVNAGVPKTLIQHLIRWVISTEQFDADTDQVLRAILDQEISPELVPGDAPQSTESVVGPYALQDFTLFHTVRAGLRPATIAFLAMHAWSDANAGAWPPGYPEADRVSYDLATIARWERVFFTRFFANQFKRSALPNGPKVSNGGTMSPRGDWRMPSDASAAAWLRDLDLVPVTT